MKALSCAFFLLFAVGSAFAQTECETAAEAQGTIIIACMKPFPDVENGLEEFYISQSGSGETRLTYCRPLSEFSVPSSYLVKAFDLGAGDLTYVGRSEGYLWQVLIRPPQISSQTGYDEGAISVQTNPPPHKWVFFGTNFECPVSSRPR